MRIEVVIEGWLDEKWSEWLGEVEITHPQPGVTYLTAELIDQAAIYGLIAKLRDLGVRLVSIKSQDETPGEES